MRAGAAGCFGAVAMALGSIAAPLHAADGPVPSDTLTVQLPEVVVTALRGRDRVDRIPAAAFVIGGDALRDAGVSRISTLLQALPGLYGYLQNASGDPSAVDPRGFTANGTSSYVKLLVNGQDVRDLENGNVDWDWMPTQDIERIEVVEGPGTWLYGDGAEGGIVNVVRRPSGGALRPEGTVGAGSFGLWRGGVAVRGSRGPFEGSVRGSGREVDGWRDRSRERVWSLGAGLTWNMDARTVVGIDVDGLDADRQNPGTLTPTQVAADREASETTTDFDHGRHILIGGRVEHRDARDHVWSVAPYLRGEDLDQVSTIFFQPKFHHTRGWTGGTDLGWRHDATLGGRLVTLSAGAQIERAQLRSDYDDFSTGVRGPLQASTRSWRTTFSGWAGVDANLAARTNGRVGVRGDLIRVSSREGLTGEEVPGRNLRAVSPFVSLVQGVGGSGTVYASFSTAFRAPTIAQLFDRRPFFDPFSMSNVFISNTDLSPQRAVSVEVGGRAGDPAGTHAMVNLYSVRVRDEIDFDVARYANIGRSWHRGIQAAAQGALGRFFTVRASGAWTPTTIRGGPDDGNQINAVPIGTAYASLRWKPVPAFAIEGGLRFVGEQNLDKAAVHPLADFTTAEIVSVVRTGRARWSLRIANLFDRRYADTGYYLEQTGEERLSPAPGRSFQLALGLD